MIGTEEELIQVEADSTIISISQGPRRKLIRTTMGLEGSEKGLLIVDENYMTTKEGVFAAGDVISGSKTVVLVVDGSKKAADAMIKYMEEKKLINKIYFTDLRIVKRIGNVHESSHRSENLWLFDKKNWHRCTRWFIDFGQKDM